MATAPGVLDLSCDRSRPHQNDSLPGQSYDMVQDLLKQRKEFERRIQLYEGDDPLELRYNFINWIEKSYPNRGLDNGLNTLLEETLSAFKDTPKYKQDTRYVALFIKYFNLQPNALEMFKCLYNQGIGTACAILYHAWAKLCEKEKEYKLANEIYLLGLNNKAEPLEDLKQVHLQLQLNVGRRALGVSDVPPNTPCRKALKKLQIDNQSSTINGTEDDKNKNISGKQMPMMKFQASLSDKENSPVPKKAKHSSSIRKIKPDAPDTFKCPVAYFDPPDPTKLVTYPKDKIYEVEGKEFQLEELIAKLYEGNKQPRKFAATSQNDFPEKVDTDFKKKVPVAYFEPDDPNKIRLYPKDKVYAVEGKEFQLEELKALEYEYRQCKSGSQNSISNPLENSVKTPHQGTPNLQVSGEKVLHDVNPNLSLFTNQSLTVATKEAINVVRGMWNSPSPVSVKTSNVQASCEKQAEPLKAPVPYKTGFQLYIDESFNNPSTSKQRDQTGFKLPKPFIPSDIENIQFVPKTGSILRSKLKEKNSGVGSLVRNNEEFGNVDNDLGVHKLNSDVEENAQGYQHPSSVKKQSFTICSDETDTVETCLVINRKETKSFTNVIPPKNDYDAGSCSTLITGTTTSTRKSRFVIECDDRVRNEDICTKIHDKVNELPSGMEYIDENQYPHSSSASARKDEPLILPYVPPPTKDNPVLENEGKENAEPGDNNIRKPARRELSGVLQPSLNIPVAPIELQNQDKEFDFANDSCCTKAFAFTLPSSTPFNSQLKNFNRNAAAFNDDNTVTYCSYTAPEEAPRQAVLTDLSVILEASKERYSSSSGSSSCGQTPYGPSMRNVNTFSEIKGSELSHISEESVRDLEKSLSFLNLRGDVDPFCPELLSKLLATIRFPLKHHSSGLVVINKDAPVLRENCSLVLGKGKYLTEKELGKGAYARVLKATHKGKSIALKYQKPAFVWEYYIASEIHKRLASAPMKNGFIEINQAYIFKNASILETEWGRFGSLINVINTVKVATGTPLKASVATFLCIQLFKIVEHLHKCNIIHGDIKPDNFILHALPTLNSSQMCLKLIDFGRSIDMTLLPKGTTFTKVVTTDGFQCNEMKENRPWTYQIDYYGLAGTAYCLLMGDYMKVIKRGDKWGLQKLLPRYLHRDVWQPIFQDLLNIESCASLPNLSQMRMKLEELLNSMGLLVSDQLNSFGNIIQGH